MIKTKRNRRRTNDAVRLFKLPTSLRTWIGVEARARGVSGDRLIRTALIRLKADLAAGETIEWAPGYSRRRGARKGSSR